MKIEEQWCEFVKSIGIIRKFLKRKYRGFFRLKNYLCRTGDSFTLPKIYVSCDFHDTFSIDNEVLISLLSVNLLNIEFM